MTGSIVLATEQGLGYLAKAFYDNGIIDKIAIHPHSTRKSHTEWYPDAVSVSELLECDTILFFETPFDLDFMKEAKAKGIKIVFMPMYECSNPRIVEMADVIINPSDLDQEYYPDGIRLNVPVDVKWRKRSVAKVFVHNAGNGGLGGRNGTTELLKAMKHVKSPIKLIVRSQMPIKQIDDPRIEYRIGQFDDIWAEGDVFVFPEKFNGLSLPAQEAYASGMVVMSGDRFPMNTWLPKEHLIPVKGTTKERLAVLIDVAEFSPVDIAKSIDNIYGKSIIITSEQGREWAEQNSWEVLAPKYKELL